MELQIQSLVPLKMAADIETRLGKLPPTLRESYWEVYNRIIQSGETSAILAIFTFRWLLFAKSEITCESFTALATEAVSAETKVAASEGVTKDEVIDVCENLVIIRHDCFEVAHLSVREFLEELDSFKSVDTMEAQRSNIAIAHACLSHLIAGINDELSKQPSPDAKDEHACENSNFRPDNNFAVDAKDAAAESPPPRNMAGTVPTIVLLDPDGVPTLQPDGEIQVIAADGGLKNDPLEKRLERLTNNYDKGFSIMYAASYWLEHIPERLAVAEYPVLFELLCQLLVNKAESNKVSDTYQLWCSCIRRLNKPDEVFWGAKLQPSSPIWLVCARGWAELITVLLTQNPYIDINERRYLHIVRRPKTSLYAIAWDAKPGIGGDEMTPLSFAIAARDKPVVAAFLPFRGTESLGIDKTYKEPLLDAVRLKDSDIVSLLVENDPAKDEMEAAFMQAAIQGSGDIIAVLIGNSHDLIESNGHDAVSAACSHGHTNAVTQLLDAGATTDRGHMFLCRAVYAGHVDIARVLLNRKIGLRGLDKALELSVCHAQDDCAALLREHGAQMDGAAVLRAIKSGSPSSAISLIDAGFDIHGRYLSEKGTALHFAIYARMPSVVKALLEAGSNCDARDRRGRSPLHIAAEIGHSECAYLLLAKGADVLLQDYTGQLPLDVAERAGMKDTEAILRGDMELMLQRLRDSKTSATLPTSRGN